MAKTLFLLNWRAFQTEINPVCKKQLQKSVQKERERLYSSLSLINFPFVMCCFLLPHNLSWSNITHICLLHTQVQTPPEWVKLPGPVKGIEKEKAEFQCEASGIPHPRYTWVDQYGVNARDKEGWVVYFCFNIIYLYYYLFSFIDKQTWFAIKFSHGIN